MLLMLVQKHVFSQAPEAFNRTDKDLGYINLGENMQWLIMGRLGPLFRGLFPPFFKTLNLYVYTYTRTTVYTHILLTSYMYKHIYNYTQV